MNAKKINTKAVPRLSIIVLAFSKNRPSQEKIDLSVSTKFIEPSELSDLEAFQYKIEKLQQKSPDKILAGGYLEELKEMENPICGPINFAS